MVLDIKGSSPFTHLSFFIIGLSPSGKAQDFDSCTRWFESSHSWSLKAPIFFGAFLLFWQGRSADAERESKLTRLPSERAREGKGRIRGEYLKESASGGKAVARRAGMLKGI